jgi:hypothetical protein
MNEQWMMKIEIDLKWITNEDWKQIGKSKW